MIKHPHIKSLTSRTQEQDEAYEQSNPEIKREIIAEYTTKDVIVERIWRQDGSVELQMEQNPYPEK